jgi:hypothetical protein
MQVVWKGKYCYEEEFNDSKSFAFELKIDCTANEFQGISIEEEFTTLTNDSPTVNGFIDNDHISYTLQYPYQFDIAEDGSTIIDRSKPGHEVIYEGYFNAETGNWEGEWEIEVDEIKLAQELYQTHSISGSWKMKME